jgi:hypothetical protein
MAGNDESIGGHEQEQRDRQYQPIWLSRLH